MTLTKGRKSLSEETKMKISRANRTHGESKTRLYRVWYHIRSRCFDKNTPYYKDYGGRGITICDEWRGNYIAFRDWALQNGYREDLTIDRIDNNGNYEPSNCRWADAKTQANNRRSNLYLTYNGETLTALQWAKKLGINHNTISMRLYKYGKTVDEALSLPVKAQKGVKRA